MARSDKLTETHERLVQAVEELASGDDWIRFLDTAKRFHNYSTSNLFLILVQRPDATRVAGFQTWKKLGRYVRAGEKGIAILAPCVYGPRRADEATDTADAGPARVLRGFRVVHVFDIAQTDGEPLPQVAGPELLAGDAPTALWDLLAAQVGAAGFRLERGSCGSANGRTDYTTRSVTVRDDVDSAQATKTLAHELAHVLLHDGCEYPNGCRGRAEVEAESVAYVVCSTAGLATENYSFPYVAHWAVGDTELVRTTADKVITTARTILTTAGLIEERTETAA